MANPSPLEFFETLYPGGLPRGRLALYTTTLRGAQERSHWCYNLMQADRLTSRYRQTRRVRFGIALHDSSRALAIARSRRSRSRLGTIRGCEGSATALPALWAEIAYGDRAHAGRAGAAPLPPGRRQGLDLLDAVSMRPSIVVSAGNTIWAFWPLRQPWLFDPEDEKDPERAAAQALLRRLHWALESRAADHGWHLDAGGGAAGTGAAGTGLVAAFPVPGTPTGGSARGPRAVVERLPLVSGDDRYRRRDFESLPEPPAEESQPWRDFLEPPAIVEPPRQPYDFRPVAAGCSWISYCRSHGAMLSKAQWKKAVRLLSECAAPGADQRQLVHAVSEGHPGYNSFETDDELAGALQDSRGSITCREIGEEPGVVDQHCSRCPHFGRIERPVDLAREAAASAPIAETPAELSEAASPAPIDPPGAAAAPVPPDDEQLESLEEVLLAFGGSATARQITRVLETESERFPAFAATFQGLFPDLRPGDRTAATALGYRLRTIKGRILGGRVLVEARRTRDGVTWVVQRVQPVPVPVHSDPKGEAPP